jgi:outer membrane protein assembly factor BamB
MPSCLCRAILLSAAFLLVPFTRVEAQADTKLWWPQFLGPQRDGISRDKGLNFDWTKTPPKVLWKVPLGPGFSSVAIVGDRIYTMCKRGRRDIVICLSTADGSEKWSHVVATSYLDRQRQGPGPRSTPTYHNGKLYCLFPMGDLVCLSAADGKRLWSANQFADTGAPNPAGEFYYWGVSMSPLVEGDLVIVVPGADRAFRRNRATCVAAYHKDSGKLLWTCGSDGPCYGSPIAVTIQGQRQLIVPTGESVLGIDPARGHLLWRYEFGNKFRATCATPVWVDGLLYVSAAYGGGSAVLEINRLDGQWNVKERWKNKKNLQTLFATAMVADGYIYGCHGDLSAFALKCLDVQTGTIQWETRVASRQSLLAVDGHLLAWSETGSLYLLEMQPKQYVLKGEMPDLLRLRAWAAPALADGRLYLRDQGFLMCIDLRKN